MRGDGDHPLPVDPISPRYHASGRTNPDGHRWFDPVPTTLNDLPLSLAAQNALIVLFIRYPGTRFAPGDTV